MRKSVSDVTLRNSDIFKKAEQWKSLKEMRICSLGESKETRREGCLYSQRGSCYPESH